MKLSLDRLNRMKKGLFIVVDGLDGIGKGVFLDALVQEAKKAGKRVFDIHAFWKQHNYHPSPDDIIGKYDLVVTSEPTFVGIGSIIRQELVVKNGRHYSPQAVAQAYALDRHILYEQLLLPLLTAGITILQSRSFSTSLVYQRQSALDAGREFSAAEILLLPGNAFCLRHPMDFLIIPTIPDVDEIMKRLQRREKDDNCVFENLDFQLRLKKQYESDEFRNLFTSLGVNVLYVDAGVSIEHSQQQARDFYRQHLA